MLTVYTGCLAGRRYVGNDAVDITRKSALGDDIAFAPSWAILNPALDARRRAESLRKTARAEPDDPAAGWALDEAEMIEAEAWLAYVPAYLAEMRASYRRHRATWDRLLSQTLATLCCYCTDPARCHRTILAAQILPTLGARYAGERPRQTGTLADRLLASVEEERALAAGLAVEARVFDLPPR